MIVEYSGPWFNKNSNKFEEWFNPETYNWKNDTSELVGFCMKYIDIWYDSSKFSKSYDELLIESIK